MNKITQTFDKVIEGALLKPTPQYCNDGLPPNGPDTVNHPQHYTNGGIECIEAIKASMTKQDYAGYLKGNCIKYLWRYKDKGGVESLKKCEWYLTRLIELEGENKE